MKMQTMILVILALSFFIIGCGSEQHVMWNLTSEPGQEVKVKVIQSQFHKDITIRIEGDNVITGNSGTDKKNEYNADYKGKSVKASMICRSESNDEIVELLIDGKLVGEFVFPQKE